MSEELARIAVKKVPASEAKAGNSEHAKLIAQAKTGAQKSAKTDMGRGEAWAAKVRTGVAGPAIFGFLVIGAFITAFGYWAASAPLAGAAVATGVVTASGQNFRVQHFEGGIINEILVREGEQVEKGQSLLTLDSTRALSDRDRLSKGLIVMQARSQRLEAERDDVDVVFKEDLIRAAQQAGLENALAEQLSELQKRRERYRTDANIIDQQILALEQQIGGIEIQRRSTGDQIDVLNEEIDVKEKLVKRKLTPRSDYLRLKRTRSELQGRLGELGASIGEARSAISQALERKSRLNAERAETAVTALNELRQQITDVQERILNAENVLSRIVVRSPSEGIVVKINKNTPGSVVRQGEDLFVILPVGGELIVEAKLNPLDVDSIIVGQSARSKVFGTECAYNT